MTKHQSAFVIFFRSGTIMYGLCSNSELFVSTQPRSQGFSLEGGKALGTRLGLVKNYKNVSLKLNLTNLT